MLKYELRHYHKHEAFARAMVRARNKGILEHILREREDEVVSMVNSILSQQTVIDEKVKSASKISYEEGYIKGKEVGIEFVSEQDRINTAIRASIIAYIDSGLHDFEAEDLLKRRFNLNDDEIKDYMKKCWKIS